MKTTKTYTGIGLAVASIPMKTTVRKNHPCWAGVSALLLLMLILPRPAAAQATFFVTTSSESLVGGSPTNDGKATYNTNTGATTQITGTATASGTANVSGLTSSFDQSTANGFTFLPPVNPLNAFSFAAADLSSASVRAMGGGNEQIAYNGAVGEGEGFGIAEIFDTLTFYVAGATSSTVTNIGINYSLNGSVTRPGPGVSVISTLLVPGADAQFVYDAYQLPNSTPIVNQIGWVSENVISATPASFIFQGVTSGQGATFVIPIDLKLNVTCEGATCDYSHTGYLSLLLPPNVTVTSASGVFLTGQMLTKTAGDNQNAATGQPFTSQLQVTLKDASNSPVPNSMVVFQAPASAASGAFGAPCSGTACVVATNASGVATAPAFTANATPGMYNVTATVGAVAPVSFSLTNTHKRPVISR